MDNKSFAEKPQILNFDDLIKELDKLEKDKWVFRGQLPEWHLETTLERTCKYTGLNDRLDQFKAEDNMIRQFKRVYDGEDKELVNQDTLYCLSLMRHYGAPVRLLDFTFSYYIAIYFALEYAFDKLIEQSIIPAANDAHTIAIWCINVDWVTRESQVELLKTSKKNYVELRNTDKYRNEDTFRQLYLNNKFKLVSFENPFILHSRLHLQQGTFLCPGDVTATFEENIKALSGWDKDKSILKVQCTFDTGGLIETLEKFRSMNITRESLFPGLDGFAQAMKYHIHFYQKMHRLRKYPKV